MQKYNVRIFNRYKFNMFSFLYNFIKVNLSTRLSEYHDFSEV